MHDGRVHKFGSHDDILWHAGNGLVDGVVKNCNPDYIGIECEGPGFTDVQRKTVKELI